MLCCLLCLTVCVVPALAGNEQYTDGALDWSGNASLLFAGPVIINVLDGYFPARFDASNAINISNTNRTFDVYSSALPHTDNTFTLYSDKNIYVDVLFSAPLPITVTTSGSVGRVAAQLGLTSSNASGAQWYNGKIKSHAVELNIDGSLTPLDPITSAYFTVPEQTFTVGNYWGYRFHFVSFSQEASSTTEPFMCLRWDELNLQYTFSDPNYQASIYDKITINTGILQNIDGKLTEIQTSTIQIENDVSEIKNGLQDSNSSIWQSFKDSLTGLFVPSTAEVSDLLEQFDQFAKQKLGGAYQTVDMVSGGVQSVSDKFKNPGSSPGVEFPGISVPLGGDVGTVTLAASQTVTIPEKITNVLYPVSGVIIPIVCTIWTVRLGLDMVNCFMSGMSYGDFLHRHTDEEDDVV